MIIIRTIIVIIIIIIIMQIIMMIIMITIIIKTIKMAQPFLIVFILLLFHFHLFSPCRYPIILSLAHTLILVLKLLA